MEGKKLPRSIRRLDLAISLSLIHIYQDVAGIVVALGNAVLHQFPKRNREIRVGKLLPQGAVGIGQHLGCLYGNNAVQTDACLLYTSRLTYPKESLPCADMDCLHVCEEWFPLQ